MDPTPHLRRSDRRLVGGTPPARPDVRIAVVDWAPVVKLVNHTTNAIADNATTRVVERSMLGFFTTKDLELTPVDERSRLQNRDAMLRYMAGCMARGPRALAEGLQKLEDVRRMATEDLQRKMVAVRQSAQATDASLETWIKTLKAVELTCDVVTVWSPAGRIGRIVKHIGTAKQVYGVGEKLGGVWRTVDDLGGISVVLSDDGHREVVKKALADVGHDVIKDLLADKLFGKVAEKSAGLVGRKMDLINPFTGDTKGKFTFSQLVITTWVTEKSVESAGKLVPGAVKDSAYSSIQAATEAWYLKKADERKSAAR